MAEGCGGCSAAAGGLGERPVRLGTLNSRQVRFVYLITYSQADLGIVPTREEIQKLFWTVFQTLIFLVLSKWYNGCVAKKDIGVVAFIITWL